MTPTEAKEKFAGVLRLTEREYEVFCLVGEGMSVRQIASRLGIHRSTVGTYVDYLRGLFVLDHYAQLVSLAARYLESGPGRKRLEEQPPRKVGVLRPPRYQFVEPKILKVA